MSPPPGCPATRPRTWSATWQAATGYPTPSAALTPLPAAARPDHDARRGHAHRGRSVPAWRPRAIARCRGRPGDAQGCLAPRQADSDTGRDLTWGTLWLLASRSWVLRR